ncbi:MAG: hypothetical protein KDN22_31195 [Verrucomicrobiae bacterium]|nr:hypothetical protein [Verrucomicrobiae bacterium]
MLLSQDFFAQIVTVFQSELDKDFVKPGASQQVIHGDVEFLFDPVIIVANDR